MGSELIALRVSITDCFQKSDLKTRLHESSSRLNPKNSLQEQMLRAGAVKTQLVQLYAGEGIGAVC